MSCKKYTRLISALLMLSLISSSLKADLAEEGKAYLEGFIAEVLEIKESGFMSPKGQLAMTLQLFHDNVDFVAMASDALGGRVSGYSASAFAGFTYEFETFLSHRYLSRIVSYQGEAIEILRWEESPGNDRVVVHTLDGSHHFAIGKNSDERTRTSYSLKKRDGEWSIVKVVIDGMDLSSSNNPQLRDFLFQHTPELVVGNLKAMNRTYKGRNPFEEAP